MKPSSVARLTIAVCLLAAAVETVLSCTSTARVSPSDAPIVLFIIGPYLLLAVFAWWRTLPIGSKRVWIEMDVPKVECQKCGAKRRVKLGFAEPKRQHTKSFERYVMELLQFMTPADVSTHLGITWDLANDIQKRRLGKRFARPKLKKLKEIAIDEIYLGKRHKYITLGSPSSFVGAVFGCEPQLRLDRGVAPLASALASALKSQGEGPMRGRRRRGKKTPLFVDITTRLDHPRFWPSHEVSRRASRWFSISNRGRWCLWAKARAQRLSNPSGVGSNRPRPRSKPWPPTCHRPTSPPYSKTSPRPAWCSTDST